MTYQTGEMTTFPSSAAPEHPCQHDDRSAALPSRRCVLTMVAGAGAAGILTACGGGGGNDEASPAASTGESSTPAGSTEQGETSAGGGQALAATADVPVGGGVILADEKVVVTQPTAGDFKAFSSTCTHQSCTVSGVADGRISCMCHSSSFSIDDGSPKGGPARSPLPEVAIKVEGDSIVRA